jgi:hypothetical protein
MPRAREECIRQRMRRLGAATKWRSSTAFGDCEEYHHNGEVVEGASLSRVPRRRNEVGNRSNQRDTLRIVPKRWRAYLCALENLATYYDVSKGVLLKAGVVNLNPDSTPSCHTPKKF